MASDSPRPMTAPARAAFEIYRDLGRGRTLKAAAELLQRHPTQLRKWSAKHDWVRLCAEHDHAALKDSLGHRPVDRELVQQLIIDNLWLAAGVLLEVMQDRSKLPVLDRQGKQLLDDEKKLVWKYQVKPSTRANCAEKVLGLGGLVPVKRTEVVDKTGDEIDEAASVLESMHPDDLDDFMAAVKRRNKERDRAG